MTKSKKPAPKAPAKSVSKPAAKPAPKAPAKPAVKAVAKSPAKPVEKAPAKLAVKAPAKPVAKPPSAPVKPAVKTAGKSAASSKKGAPVMSHDVAVKTLTEHRVKHKQDAPSAKMRRSAPVAFSWSDVEEYLKSRANAKLNLYVPGQEEPGSAKVAPKAAARIEDKPVQNRQVAAVSVADLLGFNPFSKKGETAPEEEQIPQKFRKYYKLLIELRDHVNDGLATHTEEALKKTGKEDTGDVSAYSQHMADAGTDSFDRDFALSLVNNEHEALYEIAEAIDRMKDGTYGVCEITGQTIPSERLMAVPFARYSTEGQRQMEKNKRRGRRSNSNPTLDLGEGVVFGGPAGEDEGEEP